MSRFQLIKNAMQPYSFLPLLSLKTIQDSWFMDLLLILLIVVLILLFIRRRIRSSAEMQKWLREKVKEKTHELEVEMERAEQSEKAKEQFLANMSHEIRTPLNAILGMTRLLLDKEPRSDQMRYLNAIKESSDNLLVIINDILDLSKIEAGKIIFENIEFSIRDKANAVMQTLHLISPEKNLDLQLQIDDNVPETIIGDPYRLNQIWMNLAGNAIKFTEKGSVQLCINVQSMSDKQVTLRMEVKDTGIGISPDKLTSIFDMFTQETTSTTRKFGGTGLGLAICKRLIELQGGRIDVQSTPGKGSVFGFDITYKIGSSAKREQDATNGKQKEIRLQDLDILLAEDNEFNTMVAVDTLEGMIPGVRIDVAATGKAAVELAIKKHYDLILMDLQMPEMDGYEATRLLRSYNDEKINAVPIIAMTASVIQSEVDKCFECGMNAFVGKPFNPDELLEKIAQNLLQKK